MKSFFSCVSYQNVVGIRLPRLNYGSNFASEFRTNPGSIIFMKNKKIKKIAIIGGCAVLLATVGTAAYVFGHKPDVVTNPCWRSCHLADGRCKKAFNTAVQANWQSVKQLFLHGEVCNPYQVGDKYYTGHSKNAWCKSINPLKLLK